MAKQQVLTFSAERWEPRLDGQDPTTVLRSAGLLGARKNALAERIFKAAMDVHQDVAAAPAAGNHRNGSSRTPVLSDDGEWGRSIPRDRHGRFAPALRRKDPRRFPGWDEKISARSARGLSTRAIQARGGGLYGGTISPDLGSAVTDAVIAAVRAWQARPLASRHALVCVDALRVQIRDAGLVRNKAVYLALGVRCSGHREVRGRWSAQTEGATCRRRVMNERKARGRGALLSAGVDGRKGVAAAITAGFPDPLGQTGIVHLIRSATPLASWQERKPLAQVRQPSYPADGAATAAQALRAFETGPWGERVPTVAQRGRHHWPPLLPCFAFAAPVRQILYPTNAIERLPGGVRKRIRNQGHFPKEAAATTLIWLALRNPPAK